MKRPNLLISIPCFGGNVQHRCVASLIGLVRALDSAGARHTIKFIANESLITRARNHFANIALQDNDSSGRPFTHLLFIDADLAFRADDVLEMLKLEKPIVALPYAKKSLDWESIREAARRGVPATQLPEFAGRPALNTKESGLLPNEVAAVRHAATGLMLIKVAVFKAFAEARPESKYNARLDHGALREWSYDFFATGICPATKIYLSEDWKFCEDARALGFETFLIPWAETTHIGAFDFKLNLRALASIGEKQQSEN